MGKRPRIGSLQPRVQALEQPVARKIDGAGSELYDLRRWRTARELWLREHPLCGDRIDGPSPEHSICAREGRTTPAEHVDHTEPHRGNQERFWNTSNWQSLCIVCHGLKSQEEGASKA